MAIGATRLVRGRGSRGDTFPPGTRDSGALMSSRGKKKTTFAKLNREARLRDRRLEKQARKEARRQTAAAEAPGYAPRASGEPVADDPAL